MKNKIDTTVEKWEEISKKLRLCPECWTLSEGAGYCDCGGFKRLDFSDLPEKEQKMWIDGFERGESHSLQQAREEMAREIFEMVSRISIGEEYEPIVKDKSNQTQYAGYLRCRDLIKYLIKRDFLSDLLTKEDL